MAAEYDRNNRCRLHQVVCRANDRLQRTPQIKGTDVSCDCRDGVLHLRGRLKSYYQKQVAQEVVKRLDGVTGLVNEIEVKSSRVP